jgi:hypothetical protein
MKTAVIVALVLVLFPSVVNAEDADCSEALPPTLMLKGYVAPWDGWLLVPCRAANLTVKIETLGKLLDLEKERSIEKEQTLKTALEDLSYSSILAVSKASERSWWESHATEIGLFGFGLGLVLGAGVVIALYPSLF